MIELTRYDNDNFDFISSIETFIRVKIDQWRPKDIYLTRIDNWFDDKWVKFTGTNMHELFVWRLQDITVPPFHPNRVVSSDIYTFDNGHWTIQKSQKALHIIQASMYNLKRKISDFSRNGLFIWYSGNSKTNNKGTLMCYLVKDNTCYTFYISLSGDKNWNVSKTAGIPTKEVQEILTTMVVQKK